MGSSPTFGTGHYTSFRVAQLGSRDVSRAWVGRATARLVWRTDEAIDRKAVLNVGFLFMDCLALRSKV